MSRRKFNNVKQSLNGGVYSETQDLFKAKYSMLDRHTGHRLHSDTTVVNRGVTKNQIELARELDIQNNLKLFREQLERIKHIFISEMLHLQNILKGTNLRLDLNRYNKIYTLNYNGDNEKIKELVKDFNEQLLNISKHLSIDTRDFINIPILDYDRLILELGKISLKIGELSNKLMYIKEQSGGKPVKYKSTGNSVFIIYKNKNIKKRFM